MISFTDSYNSNANCEWAVMCPEPGMVPTFHVNRLDLESGFDFLQIQVR